jgi:predicted metal-dependent hydrolase
MQIDYHIKYSNRKTLNITIERDRQIVVHAPENLSEDKIKSIVLSKKDWVMSKLLHTQKYPIAPDTKEFVSGETLMYLGKNYKLSISNNDIDGVEFDQQFKISSNNQTIANELFRKWYKSKAIEKIQPIAVEYAENLGVRFNECKISDMRYRWGSCTPKNNLNFNWRIIKAPIFVIRYIVVHELTHLIANNHTAEFWNILSIQAPDYQIAKDWLKENGYLLEVDF